MRQTQSSRPEEAQHDEHIPGWVKTLGGTVVVALAGVIALTRSDACKQIEAKADTVHTKGKDRPTRTQSRPQTHTKKIEPPTHIQEPKTPSAENKKVEIKDPGDSPVCKMDTPKAVKAVNFVCETIMNNVTGSLKSVQKTEKTDCNETKKIVHNAGIMAVRCDPLHYEKTDNQKIKATITKFEDLKTNVRTLANECEITTDESLLPSGVHAAQWCLPNETTGSGGTFAVTYAKPICKQLYDSGKIAFHYATKDNKGSDPEHKPQNLETARRSWEAAEIYCPAFWLSKDYDPTNLDEYNSPDYYEEQIKNVTKLENSIGRDSESPQK